LITEAKVNKEIVDVMKAVIRIKKECAQLRPLMARMANHGWKEIFESGDIAALGSESSDDVEAADIQNDAHSFKFQGIKFGRR